MIALLCGAIAGFVGVSAYLAVGGGLLGLLLGAAVATVVLVVTARWW